MTCLTIDDMFQLYDEYRIKQLASNWDGSTASTYDSTILQGIIDSVLGLIYDSLSMQYTATQIDAATSMKRVAADICMYYLEARRTGDLPASVVTAYQNALNILSDLQQGTIKLANVGQLLPFIDDETIPTEATDSGYFEGGPNYNASTSDVT